jgi:hypothetical protein
MAAMTSLCLFGWVTKCGRLAYQGHVRSRHVAKAQMGEGITLGSDHARSAAAPGKP